MTSNGSNALEQLPSIRRPILISIPWMILSIILSRYFQSLILSSVVISSSPTGKFSLVYDTGRSIYTFFPVELVTFKSLMTSVSWLSSLFNVLILMFVMVPYVLNFLANSLLIKVPWLQQSNMAYGFSSFLDLLHFILTGTTHMLTTFDFILAVAHAKEPLFLSIIAITFSIFLAGLVAM